MTSTSDDTRTSDSELPQRTRPPIWLTIGLAVVVVALGAWIIYDAVTEPAPPSDVEAAIEDFLAAYDTQDETLIREVTTDDFTSLIDNWELDPDSPDRVIYERTVSMDVERIVNDNFIVNWDTEITGASTTTGEGPWIVSQPEAWSALNNVWEGMATYVVVDEGGAKRVLSYKGDFVVSTLD